MGKTHLCVVLSEEGVHGSDDITRELILAVGAELEESVECFDLEPAVAREHIKEVVDDGRGLLLELHQDLGCLLDEQYRTLRQNEVAAGVLVIQKKLNELPDEGQCLWRVLLIFKAVKERPRPEKCHFCLVYVVLTVLEHGEHHLKHKVSSLLAKVLHQQKVSLEEDVADLVTESSDCHTPFENFKLGHLFWLHQIVLNRG